jgi:signal transduction histidine kinase
VIWSTSVGVVAGSPAGDDTRLAAPYRVFVTNSGLRKPSDGPALRAHRYFLPLAVAVIQLSGTYFASMDQPHRRPFDALAAVFLLAGPATLAARRHHPVAVLWAVLAITVGYFLLGYPRGPVFISLIVAFVTAVMAGRRVAAAASLVVGYISFVWLVDVPGTGSAPSWGEALGVAAWLIVLFTVAEVARGRRERATEATRAREEESRRRASEERVRIARDLHDVLAHNISLINVQAGVALHLMDDRPEQARTALTAIKQASNEALRELRSVLEILREGDEAAPRSPASGLARLDDLVARTRATGLHVVKQVDGTPNVLPREVDLAAFRIVQEALTNVTRHSGADRATVRLSYTEGDLTVQVDDDGMGRPAQANSSGGRGLRGMRERVAALGGELEAGARPGGGFRVRARLPLHTDDGARGQ